MISVRARTVLGRGWMLRLAGTLVLVGAAVTTAVLIDASSLAHLRAQFENPGAPTILLFVALYAAVTLAPLPKAVFTIAAGVLFGVPAAIPIVLIGALAGAVIAFSLGRLLGRNTAQRLARRRLATLDAQLNRHGLWAVAALRLVPIVPFTAMNYLAGVTALRLWQYIVGTLIGMAPATTAYTLVGAYGSEPGSWPFLAGLAGLVALTVVAGLLAARHRRTAQGRNIQGSSAQREVSVTGCADPSSVDGQPTTS